MSSNVIVSAGTDGNASGRPHQGHIFYAINDAAWWCIAALSGSLGTIRSYRSTDLATWTAKNTFTAVHAVGSGFDIAVTYDNISSNDVVHVVYGWNPSGGAQASVAHVRATISSGTLTWGTGETVVSSGGSNAALDPQAISISLDTSNLPVIIENDDAVNHEGNPAARRATNTDSGTSWTAGWGTGTEILSAASTSNSASLNPLASAALLALMDDGNASHTHVVWSKYTTSWTATANVETSSATFNINDWSVVEIDTTHIHFVRRTGSNTYEHRIFNGTSWSAGWSIPTQNSLAGGGVALATDGTNIWLFVIDTDAPNTVRYIKGTVGSTSWGTWTALETSTQTRTNVAVGLQAGNSTIAVLWTQANGVNFDLTVEGLSIGGGSTLSISVSDSTTVTDGQDPDEATDSVVVVLETSVIKAFTVHSATTVTDVITEIAVGFAAVVNDSSTVTDVPTLNIIDGINVSDSSAVTDSTTVINVDNINVNDASAVTDVPTVVQVLIINVNDSSAVTDVPTVVNVDTINVNDSSTVTESIVVRNIDNISVNDASTVTDVPTLVQILFINVSDSSAVTESVTVQVQAPASNTINVFDSSAVTDTVTIVEILTINVNDSSTVTDVPNFVIQLPVNVNDASAITESVTAVEGFASVVSDSSTVTDSVSLLQILTINVFDSSTVTDVPTIVSIDQITVSDSSTVTDANTTILVDNINVSDASTVSDANNLIQILFINVFDGSAVTEFTNANIPGVASFLNISVFDSSQVIDNFYINGSPVYKVTGQQRNFTVKGVSRSFATKARL